MGAQFDSHVFDHKPTQQEYDNLCESRAYDHGHGGYSGTFAESRGHMQIHESKVFDSHDEAHAYLEGYPKKDEDGHWVIKGVCQKWEPGIAVPFRNKDCKTTLWLIGAICSS